VNPAGLDFYERLVDGLLERGIEPTATLFHWDLPAALDDRGGWLNPDIAQWFADYAQTVFRRLDGRVKMWATLNEPWVVSDGGYLHGKLAPGHHNLYEAPIASHNLLGRYPAELKEVFGDAWPQWPAEDYALIGEPLDFIGVNYYTRNVTRYDPHQWPLRAGPVRQTHATYTETGWEVFPQGLTDVLVWVKERYGNPPVYITENGAAFYDPPAAADQIADPLRVNYLRRHIGAVGQALQAGCDLRGYFAWSLLDNLEWSLGFAKRFGIVHVDFDTLQRTPKASAHYYSRVIASNGAALDDLKA
jgi:beta-glucosidase